MPLKQDDFSTVEIIELFRHKQAKCRSERHDSRHFSRHGVARVETKTPRWLCHRGAFADRVLKTAIKRLGCDCRSGRTYTSECPDEYLPPSKHQCHSL